MKKCPKWWLLFGFIVHQSSSVIFPCSITFKITFQNGNWLKFDGVASGWVRNISFCPWLSYNCKLSIFLTQYSLMATTHAQPSAVTYFPCCDKWEQVVAILVWAISRQSNIYYQHHNKVHTIRNKRCDSQKNTCKYRQPCTVHLSNDPQGSLMEKKGN